ncbi:Peptidyl-prolyl cis-trans isomerase PASTICCINO [Trema orientale]|uniref:peptidylprolyl isomerase n=1 Tax=Trema orientale TaxID=63057 RepID=A0A2P5AXT7_TREOI|nr:Peptidyl-prolyl cis-trans isomerase PASTICCINO [Trema orientale]
MAVEEDAEQGFMPQKKKSSSDEDKRRKKIVPGSLMKALMRPGGGDSRPSDGDQVIYHCTIRTLDGVVVESTRPDHGGKGVPIRNVLGKSKMILGLLEGIPTMLKGEVAMFKMKPQLHYGEDDCPISVISDDMGVVKKVITEGKGWESPREPYEVKAWISAKTGDGKEIVSRTQGEPFFFTFGKTEVPKGLEMGIGTMARGERAIIYVTSQYLTQSPFMPEVEGIEEVHFDVELVHFVQVRDMLGDGRLIKRRIQDGKGDFPMDCPLHDSLLCVHYKGMLLYEENRVFYDTRIDNNGQPLEFSSGEGLVPEGFEMCVRLMLPGEIALVTCPPDYAYDKFPRPANVPEGAHIQWEIELLGFEMPKDWTGMNFQSIMDDAEKIRSTGNRLFKEGKYELAKAKYDKVLREFNHVNPQDDEEGKVFVDTRVSIWFTSVPFLKLLWLLFLTYINPFGADFLFILDTKNLLHLNVAACYLKMGECKKSVETCNKVLEANPAHVKALYRRGMAYMAAGDFEEARTDFQMMIKADKSSEPDAKAALLKLKQKEQEVERKVRKQFKGLFDKKPGEISHAGTEEEEDKTLAKDQKEGDDGDSDGNNSEESHEAVEDVRQASWFSFWPTGRRLFSSLGLQRCTIL